MFREFSATAWNIVTVRCKSYLDLFRVSNLPTVWTNALAATVLAGSQWRVSSFLLIVSSISCFYMAGMALNDLWDVSADRVTHPLRPITSGRVSVQGALTAVVVLFGCALGLIIYSATTALPAALLLVVAIVYYNRFHKVKSWCVFVMGACRSLVFVVASLGVCGVISKAVWIAAGVQFGYVVILTAVARYEGRRGRRFRHPVVPIMIAGVSLIDGMMMGVWAHPLWAFAGVGGTAGTLAGQRLVKGD